MVLGATWGLMWASHFSRKLATVSRDGSTAVPPFSSVSNRAASTCACRFVPAKLCQRRLRLPVTESRTSMTMAQWPGERSRMWPFILFFPLLSSVVLPTTPVLLSSPLPPPWPPLLLIGRSRHRELRQLLGRAAEHYPIAEMLPLRCGRCTRSMTGPAELLPVR